MNAFDIIDGICGVTLGTIMMTMISVRDCESLVRAARANKGYRRDNSSVEAVHLLNPCTAISGCKYIGPEQSDRNPF